MISEVYRHRMLIWAFANRDLATRYRTTVLGWAWALLQPMVQLIVFAFIFTVVFRVMPPPLGSEPQKGSYVAFLFTGIITFTLFSQIVIRSMTQIRGSADLLKKAYFPAWAPLFGGAIVQLIQTALELSLLMVVFLILGNIGWSWFLAIPVIFSLALFAQGVGLILAVLSSRFGDIELIVVSLIGALYFLTPVLYPLSLVESLSPTATRIIEANPVTWYVQAMHEVMYSLEYLSVANLTLLFIGGALSFLIGLAVFNRFSSRIRMWL
jgi:ABC-type polysaccharide/polyol phosphate export permease